MDEAAIAAQVSPDALLARLRLDKDIVLHTKATPTRMRLKDVRIFRASSIHDMCPVEAAYAIKLVKKKDEKRALAWARHNELKAELVEVVDTGTVVHRQLQYYAGLTGKVREGQWRCPACGALTVRGVPMPVQAVENEETGLEDKYPARCRRCKGGNLAMFPPWLYVEPRLVEAAKGVPEQFRVVGHADGIWTVAVIVDGKSHLLRVLVDYKTSNLNGFDEKYGELPAQKYVSQMQVYLNLAEVEVGLILYYSKNDSRHKNCLVRRDRAFWNTLVERVRWARKGNMKDKGKYRVCSNVGHPRSRSCYFQEVCWGTKAPENFLA